MIYHTHLYKNNLKPLKKGSRPVTGAISDNRLHKIFHIPKSTLGIWKNGDNYKNQLYWFLKSHTEDEIKEFLEKSKLYC